MPNRIWVDVEDLFQYSAFNARPSGIQRIQFELCRSLALMPETRDRVGFIRHASAQDSFQTIPFAEIDALHARMTASADASMPPSAHGSDAAPATPGSAVVATGSKVLGSLARRVAYRIPLDLRTPMVGLFKAQRESVRAAGKLTGAAAGRVSKLRTTVARGRATVPAADGLTVATFDASAGPGDVLLILGSPWFHPFYNQMITRVRDKWQMRIALLIYDIIPLLRPEWCDRNLVDRFEIWACGMLSLADTLLTISQASAHDILAVADRRKLPLRATPSVIPIGTGFSRPVGHSDHAVPVVRTDRLPPARSYVLMVSTIEARKNHALLFRVWRRLLDEMPADRVPTLVFAGRVGWLVADLMQQLTNARYLDGKILLVENPEDGELERLYDGCLFTVFPSFYEGWGLPVTESFSFGRPCIISNASALPEAGGPLARYFDPENGTEACRVIRQAIEDPDGTEAWSKRVASEFRPVSWDESARAILRAIDHGRNRLPVADAFAEGVATA
ncbi:glycosyltransferase family 4 protein [Lichenicola cladoniae]|uniref:Glycosyltransferase family 4 protein n=1 Tax=Lichenicola cladoniae TaxID=1484109 RepID=A0A6M8HUA8_9PROT|nr:glycosyltransferase family 1 protein [Lichenicola cladoniae]NPD66249.1 glycosyltransferase family 4 protein [Acetobacteraceae bacterium]QKE92103.1 glycosyltransferase family 4 protein [Lichenicola cladoniae]